MSLRETRRKLVKLIKTLEKGGYAPTLVRIDRKSIKKNPNSGRTDYHEFMGQETVTRTICFKSPVWTIREWLSTNGGEKRLIQEQVTVCGDNPEHPEAMTGYGTVSMKVIKKAIKNQGKEIPTGEISVHNNFQHIKMMTPEPAFFYKYKPTKVKCRLCKGIFKHNQIISMCCGTNDNGDDVEVNVCPLCKGHEPVELQFEKISEIKDLPK